MTKTPPASLRDRLWLYQQERFPLVRNAVMMAVFSSAAVIHSALLRRQWSTENGIFPLQMIGAALLAFIVVFLFSLQARIVHEIRDFELERRQLETPLHRRMVTVKELGLVAIASGMVQLGLTLALGWQLVLLLLLVWGYLLLLRYSFSVPALLRRSLLARGILHTLIMPLMGLYASACDWWRVGVAPPAGLFWFLLVSFCVGMAIELGHRIRAPKDESPKEETYSQRWGRQGALMVWLSVIWLTTLATLLAGMYIRFTWQVALVLLLLLTAAIFVAWKFYSQPTTRWANWLEWMSGIWAIALYLSLGIIPLTAN